MPGGGSDHSSSSAKPAHGQPFCTQTTLCFLFSVHYLINYTRSSTHYNKRGFALTVPSCRLAKRWCRPGCAMVSNGLYLPHAFWLRTFATYKRFTGLQPHHKLRKIWAAIVPTGSPEQLPQERVGSAGRRAGREDPRWPGRIRDQGGNSTFPETSLRPLKQGLATLTCRRSLLCCLFLYDPQTKDSFWCFLMGGEKSKEDIFLAMWKVCAIQISVKTKLPFIGSQPRPFMTDSLWVLWALDYKTELSPWDKDHVACKAWNIYSLALHWKQLWAPALKDAQKIKEKGREKRTRDGRRRGTLPGVKTY